MSERCFTDRQWTQTIAERIGHFGLGDWLYELGRWLDAPEPYPPSSPTRFYVTTSCSVSIKLHDPAWSTGALVDPNEWVLYEASLSGSIPLPFALDLKRETRMSAVEKLSNDVYTENREPLSDIGQTVTYFLPDLRVVIIEFEIGGVGINNIKMTRLFSWPDWRLKDRQL